jgi:hypothetical protein
MKRKTSTKRNSSIVQARNPLTKRYIKIDRVKHRILSVSKIDKPFTGIPVIRKKKK